MKRKTIFITSFHGLVSRVLLSGVLNYLQEDSNIRIVLFVPDFKREYFIEIFGHRRNLIIEGVSRVLLPRRVFILYKLAFVLLDTRTARLVRYSFRGYRRTYERIAAQLAAGLIGKWKVGRELFRKINFYVAPASIFGSYFEKYNPSLVFSTDIKEVLDTQLLLEARKRGVKTVGMVRSWDYLTGKGITRLKPDEMVVHNETIKREAITYADMIREHIFVTGIPHFDPYVNTKRSERTTFFKRMGLNLRKRLIFYAPWGDKFLDTDWQFLTMLDSAIERGELPSNMHILVRLPPGDTVTLDHLTHREHVTIDSPGVPFKGLHRKANEMSFEDLLHLADSLYYSDVIVTPPSTIVIDACAFDKPVVLMAFDGDKAKSYYDGIKHYYDFDHVANLVRQGGGLLAKNRTDLIFHINTYLVNPALNREDRARVVREQCFKLDGKSSKRLADFILSLL